MLRSRDNRKKGRRGAVPSRKRRAHRPFIPRVLSAFRTLAITACSVWLMYAFWVFVRDSESFRVRYIRVAGARVANERDIIVHSGITNCDNIFFMNVSAIQEQVRSMPNVKTCDVSRLFPDRVVIDVVEREAMATLLVNNRGYVVDEEGVVVREIEHIEKHVGPFITNVPQLVSVKVGQRLPQPELREGLALWRAFSETAVANELTVSEISVEMANLIRMYCDELDYEIRWRGGEMAQQAWKLDVFWQSQAKPIECREYLDLRFGDDVACK